MTLSLAPLSALADRSSRENEGVPFRLLQQRIDALRLRVDALEAARPTAQSCQAGQFVAAVTATGTIVCAAPPTTTTGGGGTTAGGGTTTPPGPVSDPFRAALQQAFSALSGANAPLQPRLIDLIGAQPAATIPTSYDLTIGAAVFAQTSATAGTITVAVPSFVVHANYSNDPNGVVIGGTLAFSAGPGTTANIDVTVETTPTGKRRLGSVTSIQVNIPQVGVNAPIGVTGSDLLVVSNIVFLTQYAKAITSEYVGILGTLVPPALATLPEF
ncbi:MAG TPA: hypothetical protein VI319_11210 [Burkholderiales bacterium]